MNNINFPDPQEYDLDSFGGTPAYQPPPKQNKTRRNLLLACGGCSILLVLVCVCCIGVTVFAVQQPSIIVTAWATYMDDGTYDFASAMTCEGSQAKEVTRELINKRTVFPDLGSPDSFDDVVVVNTFIRDEDGERPWNARFTVIDGGVIPFGKCIETIEIVEAES